jgi:hypothetical protein
MVWNSPNMVLNMTKRASKSLLIGPSGSWYSNSLSHHLPTWYREGSTALTESGGWSGFQWLQRDGLEVPVRSIPYTTNFKIPSKTYECRETSFVLNIQFFFLLYKKLVVWWSMYNYWCAAVEQKSTSEHQIWEPYNWCPNVCFLLQAKSLSHHGIDNRRPATICQYKLQLLVVHGCK